MTHPAPHPGTPTPPPGPSRFAVDFDGRLARSLAAEVAGSRGHSAAPMSGDRRADNYRRQTGRLTMTPRQWRRFVHKAHRASVPALA